MNEAAYSNGFSICKAVIAIFLKFFTDAFLVFAAERSHMTRSGGAFGWRTAAFARYRRAGIEVQ